MSFSELLLVLILLTALGWLLLGWIGILDQFLYPPLYPVSSPPSHSLPFLSVIIPARNEERNIERCLSSLKVQDYPSMEILVVDDQSTDRTGEIVKRFSEEDGRIRLIPGKQMPEGWVGKGWALYQGFLQARGDYLLLLDADTRLYPGAILTLVLYARKEGLHLLNPIPFFTYGTFWEKVLGPLLWTMVRIRFPWIWVNRKWIPDNMAFGPLLLLEKNAYKRIDGHRLVARDILEDVALAKLLKSLKYNTRVVNGRYLYEVRMYHSLREIVEGWTKTAYGAMGYNPFLMILAILGSFWIGTQPFITFFWAFFLPKAWIWFATLQVVALFFRRIVDIYEQGYPLWTLLFHPVGMFIIHFMQVSSMWRYYFGVFVWKGRQYRRPGKPVSEIVAELTKKEETIP